MADHHTARIRMSAAGQEAWRRSQSGSGSAAPDPHVAEVVEIRGPLDTSCFEEAVRRVTGESEALRLRFADGSSQRGETGQEAPHLEPSGKFPLPLVDLSGESDPRAAADEWERAELARPLGEQLSAQALLRLSARHFRWFHRHHLSALDSFGCALVTRRVAEVYTARTEGWAPEEGSLVPLSRLEAEETEYRASEKHGEDRDFWLKRYK
ncbi:MAG TPA: condensation domain-containing protein, partial [Streptomyces sp.]|nr:condensation domain-containing protein [Streptomyces sp.]